MNLCSENSRVFFQRGFWPRATPWEKRAPEILPWNNCAIWAGLFARAAGQVGDWKLLPSAARGQEWPGALWAEPARAPKAEWVGRLFFAGGASEELQPIYLHPAVIAAPRFDAAGQLLAP